MANITIITTTNSVEINYGDYAVVDLTRGIGKESIFFLKSNLSNITLSSSLNHIHVYLENGSNWIFSFSGYPDSFIVDSIDGVTITSDLDLYNKLKSIFS